MFQPKVLSPKPDPHFVRELRLIDSNLRVVWAYERYLKSAWAIERRLSPEEYFTKYGSLLEADGQRIVPQPIFDTNQAEHDPETGEFVSYKQIGVRDYDLAPEYECMGLYDPDRLDARTLTEIRRAYAWNRNHPISRAKFEEEQAKEQERTDQAQKDKRTAAALDGLDEALLDTRVKVQFGYGETRNE